MKPTDTFAALCGLASLASAIPTKRQSGCLVQTVIDPNQNQTKASISQWNNDVITVNDFLNNVPHFLNDSDTLLSQTQIALTSASDEPCQLMTLASQPDLAGVGIAAFDCAVSDLMDVFDLHVIQNLMTIISNPTDTKAAQMAVDDVNAFRCCNVLPDVDILFINSATDQGIADQVPLSVGRENACDLIICTAECKQLEGANGT